MGRVSDGARTRNPQDHNLVLCQLSYTHHRGPTSLAEGSRNPGLGQSAIPLHPFGAAGSNSAEANGGEQRGLARPPVHLRF